MADEIDPVTVDTKKVIRPRNPKAVTLRPDCTDLPDTSNPPSGGSSVSDPLKIPARESPFKSINQLSKEMAQEFQTWLGNNGPTLYRDLGPDYQSHYDFLYLTLEKYINDVA